MKWFRRMNLTQGCQFSGFCLNSGFLLVQIYVFNLFSVHFWQFWFKFTCFFQVFPINCRFFEWDWLASLLTCAVDVLVVHLLTSFHPFSLSWCILQGRQPVWLLLAVDTRHLWQRHWCKWRWICGSRPRRNFTGSRRRFLWWTNNQRLGGLYIFNCHLILAPKVP